jgi:hypothetical protein
VISIGVGAPILLFGAGFSSLGGYRASLARLGIELEPSILPVNYAGIASTLKQLNETLKPNAILHFGLAARLASRLFPARHMPRTLHFPIAKSKPRFAARAFATACRSRRGTMYATRRFIFRSHARAIGFIHVPRLARGNWTKKASRSWHPSLGDVIRAALLAILAVARKIRHDLATDLRSMAGSSPASRRAAPCFRRRGRLVQSGRLRSTRKAPGNCLRQNPRRPCVR